MMWIPKSLHLVFENWIYDDFIVWQCSHQLVSKHLYIVNIKFKHDISIV